MKPQSVPRLCIRRQISRLQTTIPSMLSLSALLFSLLAIAHLSYRHLLLLQLNNYPACTSDPPLASSNSSLTSTAAASPVFVDRECDIFRGEWVPDPEARPYYTNETCSMIQEHQNCIKYGRPDMEFLKWRWRPAGCELPRFDPIRFLEQVRGKSMAFVGDSLARNHMQSLLCLLSTVAHAEDISATKGQDNKRFFYATHNFTLSIWWSPFLVKAREAADGLWHLHLDKPDGRWAAHVAGLDYLILSSGTWFTRPSIYHKNRRPFACNYCTFPAPANLTHLPVYSAHRTAFRSALKALSRPRTRRFGGVVVLRTVSPSHFEGGKWDEGGRCERTRPARGALLEGVELEMYWAQVKEFRRAQKEGAVKVRLLDSTTAMVERPDGHPDVYGHWAEQRVELPHDCVHWCLPGPVDLWNEMLQHLLSL